MDDQLRSGVIERTLDTARTAPVTMDHGGDARTASDAGA